MTTGKMQGGPCPAWLKSLTQENLKKEGKKKKTQIIVKLKNL